MRKMLLHRCWFVGTVLTLLSPLSALAENTPFPGYPPGVLPYTHGKFLDTLPPVKDRFGDFVTNPKRNSFDLPDPKSIQKTVEYDPATGRYIVTEKIGDDFFRPPTYLTFEEYLDYRRKEDESSYFRELAGIGQKKDKNFSLDPLAKVDIKKDLIDRLFGGNTIRIEPRGNVDLTFSTTYQRLDNPVLPRIAQRQWIPMDFNMNINVNVQGQIGEKLNLNTNFNTGATFDFDNQIKLSYNADQFSEDEILKKIEAGNVSLPLRSSLIQGGQSLFGLKTELQFGHLRLTAIASQQRSQRQNLRVQGGSQVQNFEVRADQYDENRHFFLSHFNRAAFEPALQNLPQIKSVFKLENIEVWITNDRNEVENVRDIIALADMAEGTTAQLVNPEAISVNPAASRDIDRRLTLPTNEANNLYDRIAGNSELRRIEKAVNDLQMIGLQQTRDFEKVSARRLKPSEYTVNADLGFISLNINVLPDQVIGVAYTYSYNGRTYKVGELSNNSEISQEKAIIDPNNPSPRRDTSINVLFVKMLKSTTQRTDIPTWDLMMKNVYAVGAFQVNPADFRLDIFYDDPGQGFKRFLPESNLKGIPLLRVFNVDVLNTQGDPQPDGIFDFVPGLTINNRNGRVMFPVLEPFGSSLVRQIDDPALRAKFSYQQLYDSTLFIAQEFQELNRFVIKGSYKSSVSAEISLGAFNVPPGSVRVSAGGQALVEGRDFEVDYNIGRVRILNDAILASGVPVDVSYEDNTLFGFQQKSLFGLRADYQIDKNFNVGATLMRLFERPFTQKVNIGDDPINNTIYGIDMNISRPAPFLTKLVDAIPGLSTKAPSSINFTAEAAALRPGHSRAINQNRRDRGGVLYIDDFEGTSNSFDLRQPVANWYLASVPRRPDIQGGPSFPEGLLTNDLRYGTNRARLSWYRIDQTVRSEIDLSNPYSGLVPQIEVFPNVQLQPQDLPNIPTLDLTFNPKARGPYNFDIPGGYPGISAGVQPEGDSIRLRDPQTRWGGIMRALNTNDFQAANIEFLEFWVLSPFLDPNNPSQPAENWRDKEGAIYINLGNISEDILRDGQKFFENGLKSTFNPNRSTTETMWSRIPRGQQIVNAFDNDTLSRRQQDVGLDGLADEDERQKFGSYLSSIAAVNPNVANAVSRDPSGDNFRFFTDESFPPDASLITRYRDFNNPEGNSRTNTSRNALSAATNLPDAEDLNFDNTLNESEAYFEYKVNVFADPNDPRRMIGSEYITDEIEDPNSRRIWYRIRIPLNDTRNRNSIGGIRDFRSIRFIRMYLQGFRDQVTFRFARLELVRNQWRRYNQELRDTKDSTSCTDSGILFDVDAVNIEENSNRTPFNYVLPIGIQREQALGVFNTLQNEQSLALNIQNLCDGTAKAVFRNINLDLRVYERFKMFVHAETEDRDVNPGDLTVFVRIGSDFRNNYYEYEVPLVMSDPTLKPPPETNPDDYKNGVWRPENEVDFPLDLLRQTKIKRDSMGFSRLVEYVDTVSSDVNPSLKRKVKVKGSPNLGLAKIVMVGVRNVVGGNENLLNTAVWLNEMRLTGLDERGGVAALGRLDVQLADLGTVTAAGNFSSIGFGALDKKVAQRSRENVGGYDFAANLELGKFFPSRWGLRVPFYAQYSKIIKTPEFDPYDFDLVLKEKVRDINDAQDRDSVLTNARDVTTIRTVTFANVRKERNANNTKPTPLDISNFAFNYSVTEQNRRDPIIESDANRRTNGGFDYNFSKPVKYFEPMKKINGQWLQLVKELNFNPIPNAFTFSTLLDRTFQQTRYRFTGLEDRFNTFYNKRFTWDRNYNLQWDLTKSLKFNFNASNFAVIDEPDEFKVSARPEITDVEQYRRDSIWSNIRRLGRTKNYRHDFTFNYTLPTKLIPLLQWVQARGSYRGEYAWTAAALNTVDLGNTIQNSQNIQATADFNFDQIYSKVGFLRQIDQPRRPGQPAGERSRGRKPTPPAIPGQEEPNQEGAKKRRQDEGEGGGAELGNALRLALRPLLLLRKANFRYSEQKATILPGYVPNSRILGMEAFESPGWGFVAGWQPRIRTLNENDYYTRNDWLYQSATKGWVSNSVFQNREVQQTFNQTYDGRITVEPFRDFRIDIEFNRSFTENHSEYFKDTLADFATNFVHAVPKKVGQLNMSYGALPTLFQGSGDREVEGIKALFKQFETNRAIISQRLGREVLPDSSYATGYGRTQQEVLVPAFLSAYTGRDPRSFTLDIFKVLPKANWRLSYNGLSRIPLFSELFQNFSLTHGYKSALTVNSFVTGLDFLRTRATGGINPLNGNFYPRLEIPEVSITESFNPLIAISATLKSGMNFNVEFKSSRNLQMSFISNQLAETRVREVTIGYGHRIANFNLPFGKKPSRGRRPAPKPTTPGAPFPGGNNGPAENKDLQLQLNFSLRDDVTFNHLLDQNVVEPTRGNFQLNISPAAEYKLNQRLSLRLFTDYRRNRPRTSAGFPRTEVNGGVVVRFQLN